jgi:hypothetical protein
MINIYTDMKEISHFFDLLLPVLRHTNFPLLPEASKNYQTDCLKRSLELLISNPCLS